MNSYITMNLNFGLGKASVMLNQCSRNPNISSFSSPITEFLRVCICVSYQIPRSESSIQGIGL